MFELNCEHSDHLQKSMLKKGEIYVTSEF